MCIAMYDSCILGRSGPAWPLAKLKGPGCGVWALFTSLRILRAWGYCGVGFKDVGLGILLALVVDGSVVLHRAI